MTPTPQRHQTIPSSWDKRFPGHSAARGPRRHGPRSGSVKSFGVVFFRSGGDGGRGGMTAGAASAVVGVEHVGQALQ